MCRAILRDLIERSAGAEEGVNEFLHDNKGRLRELKTS